MRVYGLTFLLLAAVVSNAAAQSVGMVCSVRGKVEAGSNNSWTPVHVLQRLHAGDNIKCAGGGEATVVLFGKGERFRVDGGKTATIQAGAVENGVSLGGLKGPSEASARLLAGSRAGALSSRAPVPPSRLSPEAPGWLPAGSRHVPILASPRASVYVFALYDANDVLLWSARSPVNSVDIPADVPLIVRTPYVWRLNTLDAAGRPIGNSNYRWGTLTFLGADDIRLLNESSDRIKGETKDPLPYLLLAAQCQDVGAHTRAWEVLEDAETYGALSEAQAAQARRELLLSLTDTARLAARQFAPADDAAENGDKLK